MEIPDTKSIISALQTRRKLLVDDLRRRLHADGEHDQLALVNHLEETGDWAEASEENLQDLALIQHEVESLKKIDAALQSLHSGQFGVCHGCGEAIPAQRLAAQPEAMTCVACQQKSEQQQARRA